MRVRRRVALAAMFVLIVGACSGGDDTPVFGDSTTTSGGDAINTTTSPETTSESTQPAGPSPSLALGEEGVAAAGAMIEMLGGDAALDALILALERGYTYEQILMIGTGEVLLHAEGWIEAGGETVVPAGDGLGLVAVPDPPNAVSSLRQSDEPLGDVAFDLRDVRSRAKAGVDRGEFHPIDVEQFLQGEAVVHILWVIQQGYSPEQVIQAIVLGGELVFEEFGDRFTDLDCGVLYIGGDPVPPAFEPPRNPWCFDAVTRYAVPVWPIGIYAPAARVKGDLEVEAQFSEGYDFGRYTDWIASADFEWTLDGEVISTEKTNSIRHDHGFESTGTHTVGLRVTWEEEGTTRDREFTQDVEVLPFFDVSLHSLSVSGPDGTEYVLQEVIYSGETINVTGLVQGLSSEPRGHMEFEDDRGLDVEMTRYTLDELTEVSPPDLDLEGLRGWQGSYTAHPEMRVRFSVFDDDVGDSGLDIATLDVTEPPPNPTAWGGGDSCSGEGEGAEYSTQWQVRMTDNGDGTWTADIYYHDCPDRGRAHYRGPAIPITPYRWLAEVEFVDGRGPLGGNAPAQMPGPLTHYLVSQFGFEDNVQETIGVR